MKNPFRHRHRAREWIEGRRNPSEGPPLSYGWIGACKCGEVVERRLSPAAEADPTMREWMLDLTP